MKTNARIMVVDDEEKICRNVEKILAKHNFEVECATSAKQALDKMAEKSFSLLITDMVMPEMNGLELIKAVKRQMPLTKALMMTAFASTDTAVKAIRLGALDYIPKPFTPDELRSVVDRALAGELMDAGVEKQNQEAIDTIDLDIPFDVDEVAKQTGREYTESIGPSDIPVVEVKVSEDLEGFCEMGNMVCDIFKKLGATCKAGIKTAACPQKKAKKKAKGTGTDTAKLIGIDQPFDYEEVVSITGPEYLRNLHNEGVAYVPYEELKQNVERMMAESRARIDEDIPFDADEVAEYAGKAYPKSLGPSDMPVVEVTASEALENFCELGDMVCDIFKKLGATCKAGIKTAACPQKKAKKKKGAAAGFDAEKYISVDQPFEYEEVAEIAGAEYIANLQHEGTVVRPYEELKKEMAGVMAKWKTPGSEVVDFAAEPATKTILVIDDEAAISNNIRKILTKNGYHVDQALTKAEAIQRISSQPYKVILLDLKIPGVKGLELLGAIREKNPNAKVIIITGYASIETAVECARLGAVDYLAKPFTIDEIRGKTDNAWLMAA